MATVATLNVKVTATISDFEKQMASLEKSMGRTGAKLQSIGGDLTKGLTLPLAAIGGLAAKAAMDFETSFSGVRKTIQATDAEFAKLAQGMRELAKQKPVDVNVLNKIAEQAGQLGVSKDHILAFTSVIADLTVATNLTADAAGSNMARIANVMQMPLENINRMGSSIVALGNFGASTEQEMLDFAERIAGAGAIAGLTVPNILAIGNAFSSVGVEAEAGGTAVQKALLSMTAAVTTGKNLDKFGAISGMSGDQFKTTFQAAPAEAFTKFIEGLGKSSTGAMQLLQGVGFDDQRMVRAFLSMAGAGDLLRKSLELGTKAWNDNTALAHAAEERYKTFANQMQLFWNQLKDVAITLGLSLLPVLRDMLTVLQPVASMVGEAAKWFANLPEPVRLAAVAIGGMLAAVGPVTYIFGTILSTGSSLLGLFGMLPGVIAPMTGAFAALVPYLTALGPAVAIVATAWASWNFGTWIGGVTGLTDAVGRLTARLMGVPSATYDAMRSAQQLQQAKLDAGIIGARTKDIELPPMAATAAAAAVTGAAAGPNVAKLIQQPEKVSQFEQSVRSMTERINGSDVINTAKQWEEAVRRIGGAEHLTADETRSFTQAMIDAANKMQALGQVAPTYWRVLANSAEAQRAADATRSALGGQLEQAVKAGSPQLYLPSTSSSPAGLSVTGSPTGTGHEELSAGVYARAAEFGNQMKAGISASMTSLPQVIMNALQGGGDVGKSIGGMFGGNIVGGLAEKLTNGLSGMFGKTIGGALGSVIPGLGTMLGSMIGPLIGKLAGKIWGGIQGIFGTDEEAKAVNPARDTYSAKYVSQFGGSNSDAVTKALEAAGLGGTQAAGLMAAFNAADTMQTFTAASGAIDSALANAKTSIGGAGTGMTSSALDAAAPTSVGDALDPTVANKIASVQANLDNAVATGAPSEQIKALQTQLDAFKQSAGGSFDTAAQSSSHFNATLTGSDQAIQALGATQDRITQAMLVGFDSLITKLQALITTIGTAMAGAAALAGMPVPVLAGGGTFDLPSHDFLTGDAGGVPADTYAASDGGPTVNINAGNIIGNPDDLAYMVADALEGGGDVTSHWRTVNDQVFPDS